MNALSRRAWGYVSISFLCCLCPLLAKAAEGPATFDWKSFRAAADEDRLLTFVAKLDAREESLQNISYKAAMTCVNVRKKDGARRFMGKQSFEFRRLDDIYWLHSVDYGSDESANQVRDEGTFRWDGNTFRSLSNAARITDSEGDQFVMLHPSEILGLRIRISFQSKSVVQWLRDAIRLGAAEIYVNDQEYKGVPTLHLKVLDGEWRREFWLDPARGFMIIATEAVYGKNWSSGAYEVTASEQVGGASGIWVPEKIVGRQGVYYTPEQSEYSYDITEFTVGKLKEADLALPFPPDAKVYDFVRHIAYNPLPNGTYQLLAIFDGHSGDQYEPPIDNVVSKIDDHTPDLYTHKHVGTLEEQLARQRRRKKP